MKQLLAALLLVSSASLALAESPSPTGPGADVDLPTVDSNRRALDLMPLSDYACLMNGKLKRD